MTKDEALKLALEAMERYQVKRQDFDRFADEITALREALAEQPAQQEPVTHQYQGRAGEWHNFMDPKHYEATVKEGSWPIRALYTTPPAQPEQESVTLENNLALKIAGDATSYRNLVRKMSEKVMGVATSSEPVKGKVNRVQVTAEAMSDLRRFVEKGVTEQLAFNDKLFYTHKDAAWKLNATTPPKREWVKLTDEDLEFWTKELGQGELGRGVLRAVADHLEEKNT